MPFGGCEHAKAGAPPRRAGPQAVPSRVCRAPGRERAGGAALSRCAEPRVVPPQGLARAEAARLRGEENSALCRAADRTVATAAASRGRQRTWMDGRSCQVLLKEWPACEDPLGSISSPLILHARHLA